MAAARKSGLGRGLDALLAVPKSADGIGTIPVANIDRLQEGVDHPHHSDEGGDGGGDSGWRRSAA